VRVLARQSRVAACNFGGRVGPRFELGGTHSTSGGVDTRVAVEQFALRASLATVVLEVTTVALRTFTLRSGVDTDTGCAILCFTCELCACSLFGREHVRRCTF